MKNITLLLNTTFIDHEQYYIVKQLYKKTDINLIFVILKPYEKILSAHEKFYDFIFNFEKKIDTKLFKTSVDKRYKLSKLFPDSKIISLSAEYNNKTNNLSLTSNDIKRLQKENIDLIYNFIYDMNIIGDITDTIAKDGFIETCYSDNRKIISPKIAFWEVYNRDDAIGFCIQKRTQKNQDVLFRGEIATMRTVTQTKIRLFKESSTYIIKLLKIYCETSQLSLPHDEYEKILYTHRPLNSPSIAQTLGYIGKTGALYAILTFKRLVLKHHPRFGVAFVRSSWENAKLYEGIEIKNPSNHFLADPFIWTKDDRTICFVEDFDYTQNIAWISAVEIFKDNSYKMLGEVIKEDFHLSFPYLFEYEDELYMVPESTQNSSIRLYKCLEFPLKWEYQHALMSDVKTADTMIFAYQDRWWMFTNMSTPRNDDQAAQLFAFYSDSPLSQKWEPHTQNPIAFSSNYGRNGGILFQDATMPIRGRQKQAFNIYGAGLSIAKITELSPTNYKEHKICDITPAFFPKLQATHHIHSHNDVTVYDYMRYEVLQ